MIPTTKVQKEIYLPIKDFPNYQVSNLGNVKSLNYSRTKKEQNLKPSISKKGYLRVYLCKNGKTKSRTIHQLVAMAFLDHIPCGYKLVVNHINFNRADNRAVNLEVVTARENANKKHLKSKSKYVGVTWYSKNKKWVSRIVINKKRLYLGLFKTELEAYNAYKKRLNKHERFN